jgi:NAD(P)-dependent dehydrogenase (short-subunit alcohol dehydrogenase family)
MMQKSLFGSMFKPLNPPVKDWTDRRVWIVGASSGIGAALAGALLDAGARVAVSARRADRLAELVSKHPKGENAMVVPFDVTDTQAWPQAVEEVFAGFGGLDLVVLGAARYDPQHSWNLNMDEVRASYELNVISMYEAVKHLTPRLLAQRSGSIAVVGSISGYTGLPRAIVYGATKSALQNFTETLYFELAPKGLGVYLISPGFVQTPMTANNDFEMPGLMTPPEAAQAIIDGMAKGWFEIRFPRGFANGLRWVSRLPYRWRFPLLHRATKQ